MNPEANLETAILGGGCFWCLEAAYQMVNGVVDVRSGYSGGDVTSPTYEQVCSGKAGHAEVVQIKFDSRIISYEDILDIFWVIHDPTTLNRQGNDVGTQYRSVIFYMNDIQKEVAKKSIKAVAKLWADPIVTELRLFQKFYPAENYHKDYFTRNPENAYCQLIINPKLNKLRSKFRDKLITPTKL